jgi:hypothetical protein
MRLLPSNGTHSYIVGLAHTVRSRETPEGFSSSIEGSSPLADSLIGLHRMGIECMFSDRLSKLVSADRGHAPRITRPGPSETALLEA